MTDHDATLSPGWEKAALSEIAQINPALQRRVTNDHAQIAFVPMRAVEVEGGGLVRPESRTYAQVKKGYTPFLPGDVIMAKITPCMENGKTTVVPHVPEGVCFGSTEFHVVRPELGVQARWIAQFLLQHDVRRAAQRQMGGGVGQMRVPSSFLETVRIPVPPSAEQGRIADALDELLSELDAGVAALERVKAKLTLYRASVLKAAVEGTLTEEWRGKHSNAEPASELLARILVERRRRWEEEQLHRFKEAGKEPSRNWKAKYKEPVTADTSTLPSMPRIWCWVSLSQLAWTAGYGTSEKCSISETGLAVLRIPNVVGDRIRLDPLKFAAPTYRESERDLVSTGDLLVVRTNGSRSLIGRGAVVREELPMRVSFASYLIRMRLVPEPAVLDWVALSWRSHYVRQWVESHAATSAGQHNISLRVLEGLLIPFPPLAEQAAIVEVAEEQLSVVDHLEDDIDAKLRSAQALRQAILRHAFTGKLVPQDPNDEPASELLKHIAAERAALASEAETSKRTTPARSKRPTNPKGAAPVEAVS